MRFVKLSEYGKVDSLVFSQKEELPKLKSHEILIKVKACALSKDLDIRARNGEFKLFTKIDNVLGFEVSGIVEQVGSDVLAFQRKDSVVGFIPLDAQWGGYSDYAIFSAKNAVHLPEGVTHLQAAGSILAGIRAYNIIHYKAKLVQGESIAITHGASELAHLVLQLAGLYNLRIFTTISSDEELNYLQDLHVNIARIIDTRKEDLNTVILSETNGRGVDCFVDSDGTTPLEKCVSILSTHATFISPSSFTYPLAVSRQIFLKDLTITSLFEQSWVLSSDQQGRFLHILRQVLNDISKGRLKVKINQTFPLEQIREAHNCLESNKIGRIVIKM